MTLANISSKHLVTNFKQEMEKVLEGIPLTFTYKGRMVEMKVAKDQSRGQKIASALESLSNLTPKDTSSPLNNKDLYKLVKNYE